MISFFALDFRQRQPIKTTEISYAIYNTTPRIHLNKTRYQEYHDAIAINLIARDCLVLGKDSFHFRGHNQYVIQIS